MPNFDIIKKSKVPKTYRTEYVKGKFDLQIEDEVTETFRGEIPIENLDWSVGLIVGGSGTGKSTIAKELFPEEYSAKVWDIDETKPIIDAFNENKKMSEIIKVLNSVGLNTVWSYLKPYDVLSNGEKMRADLAKVLLEDKTLSVFDEFTSVVDRTVAKTASVAIKKAIDKSNKKLLLISCHDDIIPYLQPDWIFNTDNMEFHLNESKKNHNSTLKYSSFHINSMHKHGTILANITI